MTNTNQSNNSDSLDSIPATREIVDSLFSHKLISREAREQGIQLLYPSQNWGLWASHFLTVLGVSLVLSGIIYFFAFNWDKMSSVMKFGLIQVGMLGCVIASFFYKSKPLWGKLWLLSAGVLVGVFLAVFGQIYQTGADSYNLFMMWALLILPWVVISEFAVFWGLWLIISNIALSLFWTQAALPTAEANAMIFSYLILFNGLFLMLREFLCVKGTPWLQYRWTRIVLIVAILLFAFVPTIEFIGSPSSASYSIVLGTLLSVVIHLVFYFVYRNKIPDIMVITATLLSICLILDCAISIRLDKFLGPNNSIKYLLIGAITPIIFTLAIITLRIIAKKMEKTMLNHRTKISVGHLLNSWISSKLVPLSQKHEIEGFILSQEHEKKLPLFLGILIAAGAFIASISFLSFFYMSEIIYYPSELVWGLVFIGLALFFAKISGDKLNTVRHSFVTQASLFTMIIGKIVFIIGFSKAIGMPVKDTWYGITLAAFLITVVTYYLYPIVLDRFLSTFACLILLLICILSESVFGLSTAIMLNLFFFIQLIIAATLFVSGKIKCDYVPLAYAIACSLCILTIYTTALPMIDSKAQSFSLVFINGLLTISFIALIAWTAGSFKKLQSEPILVASFGVVLLGIISAPGIILSLCLMVLGYGKHENPLILLGVFFMPIFIFLYYYNLDVSLLEKSGILIGSGLVLLAGRGYLAARKLDCEA